jgi:hypothetical protein
LDTFFPSVVKGKTKQAERLGIGLVYPVSLLFSPPSI